MIGLMALVAVRAGALELRLDERLSQRAVLPGASTPIVYQSEGISEKLRALRDEIRLRDQEQNALSRDLASRERYVLSLRRIIELQDSAMAVLSSTAARPASMDTAGPRTQRPKPIPIQIPAESEVWLETLLWQVGALFLAALGLSLLLYVRTRLRERKLSGVDSEIRAIMRERDTGPESLSVTQEMLQVVQEKSLKASEYLAGGRRRRRPQKVSVSGAGRPSERLKEIDTMIAFEDYTGAAAALNELTAKFPDNAEVRLRLLHVQSVNGDTEAAEAEERVLMAMMDGPLSDTLRRVRDAGRQMMPNNPLFSGN